MANMPWWEAVQLRDEVVSGAGQVEDVQMSLYKAVKGTVPYKDANYYGQITHPTQDLVELIAKIAVRLGVEGAGSEQAKAVWRLDQGMGGGKSHGLIGMWHLAEHTDEFLGTEIGEKAMAAARTLAGSWKVADNLRNPLCVVLSCDNMTPGDSDKSVDGPAVTLGERFLWRVVERDGARYEEFREKINATNKAVIQAAIESSGRPVLVLIDEVMDYLRVAATDEELLAKDLGFLRGLLDAANGAENCVVVMVMIRSENDTMQLSPAGEKAREELGALLTRNGQSTSVTAGGDFADIIRRRLFANAPQAQAIAEVTDHFLSSMNESWRSDALGKLEWAKPDAFGDAVARCYPFHPALITLAEHEWSVHTGFQRVRSTIQIFATTLYAHLKRAEAGGWVPELIGPGDLPLSVGDVVNALLTSGLLEDERIVSSFREIAKTEVVDLDDERGTAREKDLTRTASFKTVNPRAAERLGAALFLYSVSPRPLGQQGATAAELKAATFVPDAHYQSSDADVVFAELQDQENGFVTLDTLSGHGATRYYFSTRQTINMLIRAQRAMVSDADRDKVLADRAFSLVTSGPFNAVVKVETPPETDDLSPLEILAGAGIDDAHKVRLVVLDPRRFSLLNGIDAETRTSVRAALGIGDEKLAVAWASSAIFVCVNTQRRAHARNLASEYEARHRVAALDAVKSDSDLRSKADEEVLETRNRLDKAIRAAYQHIIYLQEDGYGTRSEEVVRLDGDNETALHGDLVWKALATRDKVFDQGQFDAQALMHQLREGDWGKPLSELRDMFWNSPRVPLLYGGEPDLRAALYGALQTGELALADSSGESYAANSPSQINLQSSTIRLARPAAPNAVPVPDVTGLPVEEAVREVSDLGLAVSAPIAGIVASQSPAAWTEVVPGAMVTLTVTGEGPGPTPSSAEYQVKVSMMSTLDDSTKRGALRVLLHQLTNAVEAAATHLNLSFSVVVDEVMKDRIASAADNAGATKTIDPL